MAKNVEKGKEGENLASKFLERRGFEVKLCNWRSGRYEIDIIATKGGIIHFVEIKTRHSMEFGYPEESVGKRKFKNMVAAATLFLSRQSKVHRIQYDILSVLRLPGRPVEYFLLEDVYMY
jgi:putative endonuclease